MQESQLPCYFLFPILYFSGSLHWECNGIGKESKRPYVLQGQTVAQVKQPNYTCCSTNNTALLVQDQIPQQFKISFLCGITCWDMPQLLNSSKSASSK